MVPALKAECALQLGPDVEPALVLAPVPDALLGAGERQGSAAAESSKNRLEITPASKAYWVTVKATIRLTSTSPAARRRPDHVVAG